MDWIRSFQKAIDYIEDHITEPLILIALHRK